MSNFRWFPVVAALALATMVGVVAYNGGVAHGLAQSGKIVAAPGGPYPYGAPYPYFGWHPWGFGIFLAPLFFFFFFFVIIRGLFWRGGLHRGRWGRCDLEEWHRQAHAGPVNQQGGGGATER